MIRYVDGNIFDEDEVDGIVNPVNCQGIMGKGLALAFKRNYPDNFRKYNKACKDGNVDIGSMFVTFDQGYYPYIVNFPTKKSWRNKSKIDWIISGLNDLRWAIVNFEMYKVAMPAVGCGLGGLHFEQVQPLIERILGDLEGVEIVVYKPLEKEWR